MLLLLLQGLLLTPEGLSAGVDVEELLKKLMIDSDCQPLVQKLHQNLVGFLTGCGRLQGSRPLHNHDAMGGLKQALTQTQEVQNARSVHSWPGDSRPRFRAWLFCAQPPFSLTGSRGRAVNFYVGCGAGLRPGRSDESSHFVRGSPADAFFLAV